jgi:hypothetical protein
MVRVVLGAIIGAIVGAMVLMVVAGIGADPAITISMPQGNGSSRPETISLASVVSKVAIILGLCTGALVGALAGVAADRESSATSASTRARPVRG